MNSDEVKIKVQDFKNGRATIDFTLFNDYLMNSQFAETLEDFFEIDYLGATRTTKEDKTTISIDTDKGKVITFLNKTQSAIVERERLKEMLGIYLLENRDN